MNSCTPHLSILLQPYSRSDVRECWRFGGVTYGRVAPEIGVTMINTWCMSLSCLKERRGEGKVEVMKKVRGRLGLWAEWKVWSLPLYHPRFTVGDRASRCAKTLGLASGTLHSRFLRFQTTDNAKHTENDLKRSRTWIIRTSVSHVNVCARASWLRLGASIQDSKRGISVPCTWRASTNHTLISQRLQPPRIVHLSMTGTRMPPTSARAHGSNLPVGRASHGLTCGSETLCMPAVDGYGCAQSISKPHSCSFAYFYFSHAFFVLIFFCIAYFQLTCAFYFYSGFFKLIPYLSHILKIDWAKPDTIQNKWNIPHVFMGGLKGGPILLRRNFT